MSMQNKIPSTLTHKAIEQKKKEKVNTHPLSRRGKRNEKNPIIDSIKMTKDKILLLAKFDSIHRMNETRDNIKPVQKEKENGFVPYAQQEKYFSVS